VTREKAAIVVIERIDGGTYGVMRVKVRLVELVSADLTQVK
jgi:hypothetical protein